MGAKDIILDLASDVAYHVKLDSIIKYLEKGELNFLYNSHEPRLFFITIRAILKNVKQTGNLNMDWVKQVFKWSPYILYYINNNKQRTKLFHSIEKILYILYADYISTDLKENILLIKLVQLMDFEAYI